jgi:hypothetical protein
VLAAPKSYPAGQNLVQSDTRLRLAEDNSFPAEQSALARVWPQNVPPGIDAADYAEISVYSALPFRLLCSHKNTYIFISSQI